MRVTVPGLHRTILGLLERVGALAGRSDRMGSAARRGTDWLKSPDAPASPHCLPDSDERRGRHDGHGRLPSPSAAVTAAGCGNRPHDGIEVDASAARPLTGPGYPGRSSDTEVRLGQDVDPAEGGRPRKRLFGAGGRGAGHHPHERVHLGGSNQVRSTVSSTGSSWTASRDTIRDTNWRLLDGLAVADGGGGVTLPPEDA
jgi:hypothetical protein